MRLRAVEVEHLVVQRRGPALERAGDGQQLGRRQVNVPAAEAMRIDEPEQRLAEDHLDGEEGLLALTRSGRGTPGDLPPLRRGSRGRDVQEFAQGGHAARLHRRDIARGAWSGRALPMVSPAMPAWDAMGSWMTVLGGLRRTPPEEAGAVDPRPGP